MIRFDELTHFTEQQYTYLLSRCRGANGYPKQVKSSTNPGGVGHTWVKERFIDIGEPNTVHETEHGTRIFIPSRIQDNPILMQKDPGYMTRLQNLDEKERKALLYGIWDIFDGQYFSEFDRDIHVVRPFEIPAHWRRYRVFDYGLDMLACYWIAIDERRRAVVYRELYEPGLIVSAAAEKICKATQEEIYQTIAPPDMWNRHKDTGRSTADIFREYGIPIVRASNDRVQGWYNLKEWLKPYEDEQGRPAANLVIFSTCKNLVRTLPAVQIDEHNPSDVAREPHELTHAPDALRYFIAGRPVPNRPPTPKKHYNFESEKPKPKPSGIRGKDCKNMTYALCALVVIVPLLVLYAYRLGEGKAAPAGEAVKKTVRECAPRKKAKPTREDLIAQNIERYNGTAGNQIRLEE